MKEQSFIVTFKGEWDSDRTEGGVLMALTSASLYSENDHTRTVSVKPHSHEYTILTCNDCGDVARYHGRHTDGHECHGCGSFDTTSSVQPLGTIGPKEPPRKRVVAHVAASIEADSRSNFAEHMLQASKAFSGSASRTSTVVVEDDERDA